LERVIFIKVKALSFSYFPMQGMRIPGRRQLMVTDSSVPRERAPVRRILYF